jgi:signal transduction histidine kinase
MSVNCDTSKEFLRRLPLFANLPEPDLDWLCEMAEPVTVSVGQLLMKEGEPGDAMYVILEGDVEVTKRSGGQEVMIARRGAGDVIGEMALLYETPRIASVRALSTCRLLRISHTAFQRMLSCSPSAPLAMLHTVSSRLRGMESMLLQHQKMVALGTLAAGLAHELNNPAAATRRSAAQLGDALADWERLTLELSTLHLTPQQMEHLARLRREMQSHTSTSITLDALTRSDREEDVEAWLEDHGVDEPWDLAPTLVAAGWDTAMLDVLADELVSEQLAVVLHWLSAGIIVSTLASEVQMSAEQISEIVTAVKTYSYLDQAPIQDVDVHASLENTLIILHHKLKTGIVITRDYADALPRIEAFGSELNQVWTNLIDNAIDAMQGQGELRLRTYTQDAQIVVEISDTGPGIPDDLRTRIFDPFFTTKPPGIGSGLGLHIVYNIIVHKHRGRVDVISKPGETCFRVTLPVRMTHAA